ncbi:hypothetical protein EYF80_039674 [Liparis tanakae]|uniref:Uncharacterized protein n=1 Tax=Liparis tanakae TaxID=230148 RepID=A0A4Z2GA82_9TELE|nr:hypothetical protein EYF80_039674 [Liparis tanakae]
MVVNSGGRCGCSGAGQLNTAPWCRDGGHFGKRGDKLRVMTSSSADHWALAEYSRKIRPATVQLKSPGKLTAWCQTEG